MVEGQKLFLSGGKQLAELPPEAHRLTQAMASLAGAKVGALVLNSPLIGANLGRKTADKIYKALSADKINKLSYEMLVNPDKFIDIVKKLEKGNISQIEANKLFKEMIIRMYPAMGAQAVGDE